MIEKELTKLINILQQAGHTVVANGNLRITCRSKETGLSVNIGWSSYDGGWFIGSRRRLLVGPPSVKLVNHFLNPF